MTNTTKYITVSNARLDDLEQDLRVLISDSQSDDGPRSLIGQVVEDSDFIPQDEQIIVTLEMCVRILQGSDE